MNSVSPRELESQSRRIKTSNFFSNGADATGSLTAQNKSLTKQDANLHQIVTRTTPLTSRTQSSALQLGPVPSNSQTPSGGLSNLNQSQKPSVSQQLKQSTRVQSSSSATRQLLGVPKNKDSAAKHSSNEGSMTLTTA